MATKIQIKRGTKTNLPTLSPGEFGLTTDTEELYIGGNNGNIRMGKNGESSTPNATATHSDSVVAITAPAGVNLISFYAPSDFSEDDTYTVNGSAVTLTDLNGNAIYDGWKEGAPVQLILKGAQAFFKSGGGVNDTLPPLNPNMTGELADGVFTVTADKLPFAQADALAGAEWYYADHVPARPGDGTKVEFTREQLITGTNELIEDASGVKTLADTTNLGDEAAGSTVTLDSGEVITDNGSSISVAIPWAESSYIYVRQFPYNAKHQYQTQLVGAVATNDPDYGDDVPALPEFEYTGTYQLLDDGDGNWRIKFTTSGTLTMAKTTTVDLFLVGGGGGGVSGGGGGGYTATHTSVVLEGGTPYTVTIGSGGTGGAGGMSGNGSPGGATSIGSYSITGGASANQDDGGNGGSGGGGSGSESDNWRNGGNGGSDGANGSTASYPGGTGQGTTTREFGEPTGELYSGGGGGESGDSRIGGNGGAGGPNETIALGGSSSRGKDGQTPGDGIGGTGGIGRLGVGSHERDYYGGGGGAGYGGGGGGSYSGGSSTYRGGNGFQGIAIIRNHREAAS